MRFFTTKLILFFLLFGTLYGYSQTVNYTAGPLDVDVYISNPCEGGGNGFLRFTINGASGGPGGSANIQIFGTPGLPIPQTVMVGSSFTFNVSQTLNAGNFDLIIVDNADNSNIINTFGADPPATLTLLPSITLTDGGGTNLTNTDCANPNGQIEVNLAGGSRILAGGGSFSYTFSATNGLAGLPFTGTFDGSSTLDLAALLGLSGLPGGDYTITIDDEYSRCGASKSWTITDPQPSLQTITNAGSQTVCAGDDAVVNLGGSQVGVTYEVLVNGIGSGVTLIGSGAGLVFNVPAGLFSSGQTLSVEARFGACSPRIMTGAITMTVNPLPTITGLSAAAVCTGITTTNLSYTGTTGGANRYTLDFDGAAQTAGFVDIVDAVLTSSPLAIAVPAGAAPGTYNATITVTNSSTTCESLAVPVTFTVNPLPTATVTPVAPICDGAALPTVTFTFTGTPPFDFTYEDGTASFVVTGHNSTTFTIPNAPVGSYTVTALSDANCDAIAAGLNGSADVVVNPRPTAVVSGGATICDGDPLPDVTFTFTGTAPFDFTYTDGTTNVPVTGHNNTTFTIPNAAAGSYQVTLLSDANCDATPADLTGTADVVVNPRPTATVAAVAPVCAGDPLPDVTITFTGTAPFDFTYTDGTTNFVVTGHNSTTFTIPNAPVGSYQVTLLSDVNCDAIPTDLTGTADVIVNALPTAAVSGGGTICAGDALPDITFTFTGTAPFNFTYTDGTTPVTVNNHPTTTFTINGAAAGSYSVTALTDANSCNATDLGGAVDVIINPLPTAAASGGGPVCAGSPLPDVTFTFTGTAPFTFSYTDGTTPVTVNNHPTNTFTISNAAAGNYSVTALSDASGCDATDLGGSVAVVVNVLPTASVSGGGTICDGDALPDVTFTFTGTAPFNFTYTDGTTPVTVNNHPTTTFTINNAVAGTYSVTALSDASTCNATDLGGSVDVIVNPLPTAVVSGGGPVCAGSPLPDVTFTFTGTAPFNFTYTDGTTPVTVNNHPTNTFTISNAPVGNYSVTGLSDAIGCDATDLGGSVAVIINALPTAAVSGGGTVCAGDALPNVTFTFTGTAPFNFTYTDGTTPVTVNNHGTTTFTINNAGAGTYSVTALSDASTCNATDLGGSVDVIVNPLPTAVVSGGGPVCAGSPLPDVTFTFTGTAPFTFTYTDGTTPVIVNNHPTNTFTISNAPVGNYSITALSDVSGCDATDLGGAVAVVVNAIPTAAVSGGGTICAGDALPNVTFTFTGTAPFTFTYTDGNTPVTVNNHPTTTFTINNAAAGTYSVTALSDASTCIATDLGGSVDVIVNPLPTAVVSGGGPVCGGSPLPDVTFTFTGTAPFTFTYTDGTTPVTVNNHPTTTFTINNAPVGNYSVTALSDASTCDATDLGGSVAVIVNPLPTAVVSGGGTVCAGDALPNVTFTFTGTAPFTFTYTDGTTPVTVNNHPTTTFTINNAAVGSYSVTALTDASTCTATDLGGSVDVIVNPLPTATVSGGGTICVGGTLPDVTFTFTGTAPFTFTYTDGITPVTVNAHPTTTFTISNAAAGTYSLTALSDASTCDATDLGGSVDVIVNPLPTAVVSGGGTVCDGDVLPNVTFTFTGTAPFTFTYTDGTTPVTVNNHPTNTFTINNAAVGTYSITALTDASTCNATDLGGSVDVIVNPLPTAVVSGGGTICAGGTLPDVTFTFTGTAPFTFTYTDGTTPVMVNNHPTNTFTINNAAAGTYSVTALADASTCNATSLGGSVDVIVDALPTAAISGGGTVCDGDVLPNVTFTFTGTAPFNFTYTDGTTPVTVNNHPTNTFTISNAVAGSYSVTALSDVNGCDAITLGGSVDVIVNPQPAITDAAFTTVCLGATTTDFTYTGTSGGADQYSIDFDAAAEGQGFTDVTNAALSASPIAFALPLGATIGTYNGVLTVRNNVTGCVSATQNISITISSAPDAGADNAITVCSSENALNMLASLNGTPDNGGVWADLDGSGAIITGNSINLTNVTAGIYNFRYTVAGAPPCADATAVLTITVVEAPDAGLDNVVTACNTDPAFDLFVNLDGTPDAGGTWVDLDGSGAPLTGGTIDLTGVAVGTYRFSYTIAGAAPCVDAVAIVTVNVIDTAPDAGSNNTVDACNTESAFNLFASLGGTPDAGGTWTDLDGSGAAITGDNVNLTTLGAGTYRFQYSLAVVGCGGASAIVTVNVSEGSDAGIDGNATVCNDETAFDLFASLGGTPEAGGAWTDLDGSGAVITGNTADLSGVAAGTYQYQYTVTGTAPCANDVAIVTLVVNDAPDAGNDAAATACNTDNAFDMLAALGGTPDAGGVWTDLDGSGATITGNVIDLTTLAVGTYTFRYSIAGTAPCGNDEAILTINVINTTPNAGMDNAVDACNTESAFDLFASLGGTPDAGGTWTDLDGSGAAITGDLINLSTVPAGTFRYQYTLSVTGCGGASAIVTVNVTDGVFAGNDATVSACTSDTAFDLFNGLGGTPDAGGAWTDVDGSGGVITGSMIDLTTVTPGVYRFNYTVTGTAPCADDMATLTVNVTGIPNAGLDAAVTVCNSDTAFDLFAAIGGTPDAGGTWIDVDNSNGVLTGDLIDFTATAPGTYVFEYVIVGTGPCVNDTSRVEVTIIGAPDAGEDNLATACNSENDFNLLNHLDGTPQTGGTWADLDGSGGVITGNVIDLTGVPAGTYNFQYTVTGTAPCVDDVAVLTVTVTNGPSVANAGPDQVLCGGTFVTNLAATAPTSGTGTWVIASGPGGFVVTPNSPTSQFIGAVGSSYMLRWIVTSGICAPSIDTVVVNFAASPVVTSPVTVCVGTAAPNLTAAAAGATGFNWYQRVGATRTLLATTTAGNFTPGAELNLTTPGTVTYEVTAIYGCGESPGSQIVVNVSNTGACGGGTGNCATVVITPNPTPATCTLSTGGVTFTIKPFVPLVNNEGVIIKIDGTSITNQNISRVQYNDTTFVNLPMGTYTYSIVYGDSSCIKPGTFTIDQSGTVGTPVASNIVRPVCAGSATGSATIDVAGETGNLLEYSFDGINWTPFVAGAPGAVTGIAAGPAPTFERLISVRRNSSDPCNAAVTIIIEDINPEIIVNFSLTPATCNTNDGAITNIVATGGSGGPFEFSLDGINFKTENKFENLPGGIDTLIVRDGAGCLVFKPFNITFPGFVQFNVAPENATCDANGMSGKITVTIPGAGTNSHAVALGRDQFTEPAASEFHTYPAGPGSFVEYTNLAKGQYFVWVKSTTAECPTRSAPININGVQAISFDVAYGCSPGVAPNIDEPYIELDNLVLNQTVPFEIRIFKSGIEQPGVITMGATVGDVRLEYDDYAFLQIPGDDYEFEIRQIDLNAFCQVVSPRVPFVVPRRLSAVIGTVKESYPDIPTGYMQVRNFDGGMFPYEIRIELDSASSFELPAYETNFEEVLLNSNSQFEKIYKNIPAGRYIMQIQDTVGCFIQKTVRVPLDTDIFVPNIFTPNADGSNDVFFIRNLPTPGARLIITNRWGKQVFSSNDYQNDWTAEGVADGIYYYKLQSSDAKVVTGWVEILRGNRP